ncbi:MAG: hypothetical protein IJN11_10380 [Oscillospiraceae bacterium]|nr:hypothetical protein [Oscillospiraceae bacterium]
MTEEIYEKRIASEEASIAGIRAHYKREMEALRRREAEELAVHQTRLKQLRQERPRAEYFRKRYQQSRNAGLCASCGAPSGEYSHCVACRQRDRARAKAARAARKEVPHA